MISKFCKIEVKTHINTFSFIVNIQCLDKVVDLTAKIIDNKTVLERRVRAETSARQN